MNIFCIILKEIRTDALFNLLEWGATLTELHAGSLIVLQCSD